MKRVALWGWFLALAGSLLVVIPPGERALRAAALLLRFGVEDKPTGLAAYGASTIDVVPGELATPGGVVRTRLYLPDGRKDVPAVVLIHGVHRLGVEEPRLQRFARAVAASGAVVYTPEITELIDYRIEPASVETIGAALQELGKITGRSKVALMGFSFAGGLSLLTASDPRFRDRVALTVSVGGHHDLNRVARFFIENKVPTADGDILEMKAHDYGLLVLLYGYTRDFFSEADTPTAHEALRLWLANDHDAARKAADGLSAEGKKKMEVIFAERGVELADEVRAVLTKQQAKMDAVSPGKRLQEITGSVYLLHGAGDNVIPPSEALWLAKATPPSKLRSVLVSQAIQHVDLKGKPSWVEQLRVVGFMASLLDEAAQEPRAVP